MRFRAVEKMILQDAGTRPSKSALIINTSIQKSSERLRYRNIKERISTQRL